MRTLVCFENEHRSCLTNTLTLQQIRRLCPDDRIIVICSGDFSANDTLLLPFSRARAQEYVKAGADLVLSLPVASLLGGHGKKEFAQAALAQNLRIENLLSEDPRSETSHNDNLLSELPRSETIHSEGLHILLPCTPLPGQTLVDCEESLRSLSMLMFSEKSDYRRRLSIYLETLPFRDAQLRTICECSPESAELLSSPENRHALWLLDSMLQLYYMPKIEFMPAPDFTASEQPAVSHESTRAAAARFDQTAAAKVAALVADISPDQLLDISGSTPQMADALLDQKDIVLSARSLEQIVSLLSPEPSDRARLFLLKAILGIRKIHMQICGLHTYVPYCYVIAHNPAQESFLNDLEQTSWIPFLDSPAQSFPAQTAYPYLLQADKKAEELISPL